MFEVALCYFCRLAFAHTMILNMSGTKGCGAMKKYVYVFGNGPSEKKVMWI